MARIVLMFAGTLGAAALGVIAARALAPDADAFLPHGAASAAPPAAGTHEAPAARLMSVRQYGQNPPAYVLGTDSLRAGPPDLSDLDPPPRLDAAPPTPPPSPDDEDQASR